MNIVNTGDIYRIYGDALKTYDKLPTGTYTVCFDKMSGFFLSSTKNIHVDEKIYGPHEIKVEKVMRTFDAVERNLGVILSGDKGIGKSICAKLIMQQSIESGKAVVLVNNYFPGIADFLASIEQDAVIVFDEFDKTFKYIRQSDDDEDSGSGGSGVQDEMLTLFDGIHQGKKLFVITCNKYRDLSEYLINRPGRFHYHFRFDYPTSIEIKDYLHDKLSECYWDQIEEVVTFAGKVNLNYDCLRAIAFELNMGVSFPNAIEDLNIIKEDPWESYIVSVILKDGTRLVNKDVTLNLFDDRDETVGFYSDTNGRKDIRIVFNPLDAEFNLEKGVYELSSKNAKTFTYKDGDWKEYSGQCASVILKKKSLPNIHYAV